MTTKVAPLAPCGTSAISKLWMFLSRRRFLVLFGTSKNGIPNSIQAGPLAVTHKPEFETTFSEGGKVGARQLLLLELR